MPMLPSASAALLGVLLLVPPPAHAAPPGTPEDWYTHVILRTRGALNGCCIGDLDPLSPGSEVVAVGEDGRVHLCRENRGHWSSQTLPVEGGPWRACVIGDVDPTLDGNELVVLGAAPATEQEPERGLASLLWRESKKWRHTRLFVDSAPLTAACIADVDTLAEGPQLYLAGEGATLWRVHATGRDPERLAELPGAALDIVPFAGGLAVACDQGSVLRVEIDPGRGRTLADRVRTAVLLELPAAATGMHGQGPALLVSCADGTLHRLRTPGTDAAHGARPGSDATGATPDDDPRAQPALYAETVPLAAVALGELDPRRDGLEAATVGDGRRLTILYPGRDGWVPRAIFTDEGALVDLRVGEVDAESPGLELVTCGRSGRLVLAGAAYAGRALAGDSGGD